MAIETSPTQTSALNTILEVRNLQTAYFTEKETIRAVDGISFDIRQGETVGIVGESGSGKSVTARSLMGLVESPGRVLEGSSIRFRQLETVQEYAQSFSKRVVEVEPLKQQYDLRSLFQNEALPVTPETFGHEDPEDVPFVDLLTTYGHTLGLVEENDCVFVTERDGDGPQSIVDGFVEITRLQGDALRRIRGDKIAMVFQDPLTSLNPVYTVGNQIKEALSLHQGLKGKEATDEAARLLEAVGIPDARRRLNEYPHQFSGGMRQRAVIAMALACDPEVLICDEPTTALDVTIQAQILDLLEEIQENTELSIMFITHDMGVIAEVSDRVNVMYAGEIVETATVNSLFKSPKHPYTRGLLESIPGQQSGERLNTIDGNVPTPNEPATSCRFAPRCPKAFDECERTHPVAVPVDNGEATDDDHTAACLLYPAELSTQTAVEYHQQRSQEKRGNDST